MNGPKIQSLSGGLNQSGLRDHNERLLLSILQRNGPLPGSDLAKVSGLSPQTISIISRKLETDGFLQRGKPLRGKVGKPSIPMSLSPDAVFSLGVNVGRRSAKIVLMDFTGTIRAERVTHFQYPMPDEIFTFIKDGCAELTAVLSQKLQKNICGIGLATPFQLWNWHELVGAPATKFAQWKDVNFQSRMAQFTDLPVHVVNDATAACRAEQIYGRGKEFRNYAYFFVAAFVGGGIVLNNSVFEGEQGNAGALGFLPSIGPNGETRQMIDAASLHLLETSLEDAGLDPKLPWTSEDWGPFDHYVEPWIDQTAQELAKAALSTCAVIDFEAVMIDGRLPLNIKNTLVERTRQCLARLDTRGLIPPRIEAGRMGHTAREIGAACGPIWSQFLLKSSAGLSDLKTP